MCTCLSGVYSVVMVTTCYKTLDQLNRQTDTVADWMFYSAHISRCYVIVNIGHPKLGRSIQLVNITVIIYYHHVYCNSLCHVKIIANSY